MRLTTSLRPCVGSRTAALGRSENSAYASSTTTIPGAASTSAASSYGSSDCPVGLFGLVRNVTSGARSASKPAAAGMSIVKSSRRGVGSHSVRVPPAMIGCIE